MITKDILKKVRTIEIKTRGLVNHVFGGEYHSVFKGRGMSFSEVREYQFGDEVRFIDWNVSARMQRPYIKIFEEEREQTLMILFDASASGDFGTCRQSKRDLMIEMAAVIAFSAIKNNDKVGLLIFSNDVEKFIPPKKGKAHVLRIIRELLTFTPRERGTRVRRAMEYTALVLRRRSIVFLLSDFLDDDDYTTPLKSLARKHDVVAIRVVDRMEFRIPDVGLIMLEDPETAEIVEVDSSFPEMRERLEQEFRRLDERVLSSFRQSRVDLIQVETGSDYIESLIRFFKTRERRLAHTF
jgi:uncharacterized protein (DUF58 family)